MMTPVRWWDALRVVLLALGFGGCGQRAMRPHQYEAESVVWVDVLRADWAPPPPISWREDVCPGHEWYGPVFAFVDGECLSSQYRWLEDADVAWRGRFSATRYANVLVEHRKAITSGSAARIPLDGDDLALVDRANAALRDSGL